jgi:7SK snRNA methylphosphate capping enzyme
MASTQIVSLSIGQMKRVHFPAEGDDRPVEAIPHFVSPKKMVKSSSGSQRKRSLSLSFENKQHHFKRRRKEEFVRPTKFLLGGNSRDPLNLGSLADERINKALNEHTPESSPLPTPKHRKEEIEVLIPSNIRDPLNLSMPDDNLAERALISPNAVTRKKRGRNRKRRRTNSASEVLDAGRHSPELRTLTLDLPVVKQIAVELTESHAAIETKPEPTVREFKDLKLKPEPIRHCRRPEDKIVSPVVPQPGARKRSGFFPRSLSKESSVKSQSQRPFSRCPSRESQIAGSSQSNNNPDQACTSNNLKEVKRFQYGNYDR